MDPTRIYLLSFHSLLFLYVVGGGSAVGRFHFVNLDKYPNGSVDHSNEFCNLLGGQEFGYDIVDFGKFKSKGKRLGKVLSHPPACYPPEKCQGELGWGYLLLEGIEGKIR